MWFRLVGSSLEIYSVKVSRKKGLCGFGVQPAKGDGTRARGGGVMARVQHVLVRQYVHLLY